MVEVQLNGWDTHRDNFTRTTKLTTTLDMGFAALVADLKQRKLLDKTLVVCMGEFGRTPRINAIHNAMARLEQSLRRAEEGA